MLQDEYLNAMSESVDKYLRVKYIHKELTSHTLLPHFDYAAFRAMGQTKVKLLTPRLLVEKHRLWIWKIQFI